MLPRGYVLPWGGMHASWGACMLPGEGGMCASWGGCVLPGGVHASQGVCILLGVACVLLGGVCASQGVCMLPGGVCPGGMRVTHPPWPDTTRYGRSMSGRFTSYRNAFLFYSHIGFQTSSHMKGTARCPITKKLYYALGFMCYWLQ